MMFTDVTKLAALSAVVLASGLAACSAGGSTMTPPVAASASQQLATLDRGDTQRGSGRGGSVSPGCVAGFSCASGTIVVPMVPMPRGLSYQFEPSTRSVNFSMTKQSIVSFVAGSFTMRSSCVNSCWIVASSTPLQIGQVSSVSLVQGALAQSGSTLQVAAQQLMLAPGSYYFYLAQ